MHLNCYISAIFDILRNIFMSYGKNEQVLTCAKLPVKGYTVLEFIHYRLAHLQTNLKYGTPLSSI